MRLSYVPIITEAWITMRHVKDIGIIRMIDYGSECGLGGY